LQHVAASWDATQTSPAQGLLAALALTMKPAGQARVPHSAILRTGVVVVALVVVGKGVVVVANGVVVPLVVAAHGQMAGVHLVVVVGSGVVVVVGQPSR